MEVSRGEGAVLLGRAVVVDVPAACTRDVDVVVKVLGRLVLHGNGDVEPVVVVDDGRGEVAALTLSYGLVNWC